MNNLSETTIISPLVCMCHPCCGKCIVGYELFISGMYLCTAAGSPTSVQETTSSKNSPMISGKTVLVPDMDDAGADSDHGETFDAESLLVQWLCKYTMIILHSVLGG